MDEKGLLELWNTKRTQVINAQKAPNFMLIGIFVLAAFGKFDTAADATKYLVASDAPSNLPKAANTKMPINIKFGAF